MAFYVITKVSGPVPALSSGNTGFDVLVLETETQQTFPFHVDVADADIGTPTSITDAMTAQHAAVTPNDWT